MLQLSEQAASALEAVRRNQDVPESHPTRLSPAPSPTGELAISLEFVESAADGDEVTETAGTKVFVDPQLVEPLGEAVMDVQEADQGLAFVFRSQGSRD